MFERLVNTSQVPYIGHNLSSFLMFCIKILFLGTVSVEYRTESITAVANVDYKEIFGSVTLVPGQNHTNLSIPIIDNLIPELSKRFKLELKNPTGGGEDCGKLLDFLRLCTYCLVLLVMLFSLLLF